MSKASNNQIALTYVVPFYLDNCNFNPLLELIAIYSRYSPNVLKHIHFVFVDDHSPIRFTIPEDVPINYTLLRITDDIEWNQGGARNLGVNYAKSDKMVLTDLDVLFPENLFESLISFEIPKDAIFKFRRYYGLKEVDPHFNVFFLTQDVFYKSQGVDEAYCGHYGHEDSFFYFLQKALGTKFYIYTYSNVVHREHKHSKLTNHNSLIRDLTVNDALNEKKLKTLQTAKNPLDARSDLYLNFNWEVLKENQFHF